MSYTCLVDICNGDDELVLATWNPRTWAKSWFGYGGLCGGLVDTFQEICWFDNGGGLVDMFQAEMLGFVDYFPVG